jgi:hypothetical protein
MSLAKKEKETGKART